jgi:cytochrome oxidase Cu insertion factor (SCO1/SenC/PrrC family)
MLSLLALCAAPVIASYLAYYVLRPQGQTNYGDLIQPQRVMPAKTLLTTLKDKPVALEQLRGNWLLVSVDGAACDKRCVDKLYWMRQLRTALGKDHDRLDRLWLVTDDAPLAPALVQDYRGTYTLRMNSETANIIAREWLITTNSTSIKDHLFLIDPQGNAMMRFPKDADANKIKRDLNKLLRASAGWQTPKPPQIEGGAL